MRYKNKTRSRNKQSSNNWIIPTLLGLSLLWLIVSTIRDKSPTATMGDLYYWTIGKDSPNPNKIELQAIITNKEMVIDSLASELDRLMNESPYRTAIVNTTANSLNLRSEPNLSSDVVVKIPDSSAVKVMYFKEEILVLEGEAGKWCKVQYADKEGWVWGNYLVMQD